MFSWTDILFVHSGKASHLRIVSEVLGPLGLIKTKGLVAS
jgi:hypothetical protein